MMNEGNELAQTVGKRRHVGKNLTEFSKNRGDLNTAFHRPGV